MTKLYVGIDIGTSSVKMGLFDNKLNQRAIYQKKYIYSDLNNGFKEIDPNIWFNLVKDGLKNLIKDKNIAHSISSIGITGQMHTTIFLDKNGKSIRPAILWNDTRTKNLIPNLRKKLIAIHEFETAKIISTGSPLANLIWVKKNEPQNFKKIEHFLMPVDYIVYRLTGKYSTDYCDASTSSLFDFNLNNWSSRITDTFSIKNSILPKINTSSQVIGNILPTLQKIIGLNDKVKVIVGTGDNAAAAFANSSEQNSIPLISLGTSGVVVIPNKNGQLKKVGKNIVFKSTANNQQILTQGTVQAGASLNAWWLDNIIHTDNVNKEQEQISPNLLGNNPVLFFPHVNGEKTLFANPNLHGAFVNISLETTRENLYLAILESVAFGCRQLFEKMKNPESINYIRLIGGGSKSKLWLKIFANVFGIPVKKSTSPREAIDGAIMLAILGNNDKYELDAVKDEIIYPDKDLIERYELKYKQYLNLVSIMINTKF